jgi:FkbM family methyltransferase
MKNMITIDIGAHRGFFSRYVLESVSDSRVIAVEPNYVTCLEDLRMIKECYGPRFEFIMAAIAAEDGQAKLSAPNILDGQIASLLPINKQGLWRQEVKSLLISSQGHNEMLVETVTVENFLSRFEISAVDLLKIDTQGMDCFILESFLKFSAVKVVVLEVDSSSFASSSHYEDSQNSIILLCEILSKYDFGIIRIMPTSSDCTELNVICAKSMQDYEEIDSILKLQFSPVLARFWNVLGIGEQPSRSISQMHGSLVKKGLTSLLHPRQSYFSLLRKLTS